MGSEHNQRLWHGQPARVIEGAIPVAAAKEADDWLAEIEAAVRDLKDLARTGDRPAPVDGGRAAAAPVQAIVPKLAEEDHHVGIELTVADLLRDDGTPADLEPLPVIPLSAQAKAVPAREMRPEHGIAAVTPRQPAPPPMAPVAAPRFRPLVDEAVVQDNRPVPRLQPARTPSTAAPQVAVKASPVPSPMARPVPSATASPASSPKTSSLPAPNADPVPMSRPAAGISPTASPAPAPRPAADARSAPRSASAPASTPGLELRPAPQPAPTPATAMPSAHQLAGRSTAEIPAVQQTAPRPAPAPETVSVSKAEIAPVPQRPSMPRADATLQPAPATAAPAASASPAGAEVLRPNPAAASRPVQAPQPVPVEAARSEDTVSAQVVEEAKVAEAPAARAPEPEAKRTPDPSERIAPIIDGEVGPLGRVTRTTSGGGDNGGAKPPTGGGGGGGGGSRSGFHKRAEMPNFAESFRNGVGAVRHNIALVMMFTLVINVLVLAIPIYLFQISDRVLTSRSVDTLIMLTVVVVGAILLQAVLDAIRRFILMRTAVEVEAQLGAPILAAAARSSLNGSSRDYQVLGDLQQLRSFITSGTLIAILDAPLAPIFVIAVFLIQPQLGCIVVVAALVLLVLAYTNQKLTARHFAESSSYLSRASLHLDSMSRNSQIINALAMIPEAVRIWGKDTAMSLKAQVRAQDRNITLATLSKSSRLITQVTMLGWGAHLSLDGHMTGGMVIASSIISARALTPIEGAIEGWHSFTQFRQSFQRIKNLLQTSPFNFERLVLPDPKGRLDVERILYVPPPNKKVILNGLSFSLNPGESLAVIGNSGAGKTTLGKMLVGSILPTSGSVRLDMMDLRNWDQRQFGESIGYLPQDVQLFPGTIKANIGRMREDATDEAIFEAAMLADVHELIASFPQGYETFVAGDGAPLSGGQKQRIALARAFFGSPKLVVLDEPNSNLDAPGEAALAKSLIHARKNNITVVTITQRTALLNYVDKILVLNNGTVSAFGERAEILKAIAAANKGGAANPQIPGKDD